MILYDIEIIHSFIRSFVHSFIHSFVLICVKISREHNEKQQDYKNRAGRKTR